MDIEIGDKVELIDGLGYTGIVVSKNGSIVCVEWILERWFHSTHHHFSRLKVVCQ